MKKYIEAVILFAKCVMVLAKIFGMWSENQQAMSDGSRPVFSLGDFDAAVRMSGLIDETARLKALL